VKFKYILENGKVKMMKKKLLISLISLFLFLGENAFAECSLFDERNPQNVCFYKKSYKILYQHLPRPNDIQIFSGDLILAEFDESPDPLTGQKRVYAGHLGEFWSPPFYSSHNTSCQRSYPQNQLKSFFTGLVFHDLTTNSGYWEKPSNLETEAFWYPSKLELFASYPSGLKVRGVKVALPQKSLALKATFTNVSQKTLSHKILFSVGLPTLGFLNNWDKFRAAGWNWTACLSSYNPAGGSETVRAKFDSDNKIVIFYQPGLPAFVAVALDNISSQSLVWELADNQLAYVYNFRDNGILRNQNGETENPGASAGLGFTLPFLSPNQSYTATLLVTIGYSETEVKNKINYLRGIGDVETYADNIWNSRLKVLQNLPKIESSLPIVSKIYYNSLLNYLFNKWDETQALGFASQYAQSNAFFPWLIGTEMISALIDPLFWKGMIKKLLTVDYTRCRAYQPLNRTSNFNLDLCDVDYSYSRYSLVEQIYHYISLANDLGFLEETVNGKSVLKWLEEFALSFESGNEGRLVDYGHDRKLFEFDIHCPPENGLSGKYTGYVVSPNSERYKIMNLLAEIYEKIGNSSKAFEFKNRAQQIKTAINTLWNPTAKWFDTISLYDSNLQRRPSPYRNTFHAVAVFHVLDAPGLLTKEQIQGILSHIPEFINQSTKRFTSLPTQGYNWCQRTDWHGPGLFVGEIGAMLTRMFDYGLKEEAAKMLFVPGQGYYFIGNVPIFQEAYRHDSEWQDTLTGQYYEGIAFAQSLIRGLAGVEINLSKLKLHPRLPHLSIYPLSLNNIRIRDLIFDFSTKGPTTINYTFTQIGKLPLTFEYNPDEDGHSLTLLVKNQKSNAYFRLIRETLENRNSRDVMWAKSDGQGNVQFSLKVQNESEITISGTSLHSFFLHYGLADPIDDLNKDGKVNGMDFGYVIK
jgi:hypothetical protein